MTAHRQGENELLLGLLKGPIFIPGPVVYKYDKFCVVFTALITSMFRSSVRCLVYYFNLSNPWKIQDQGGNTLL